MPTVVTRTIGVGRDYANFTAAEADVVNIATSAIGGADLVANDGAIVFEADAGTYTESVMFDSTLTTDATRNVTYRPASGSEHGGVFGAGVVLHDNGSGYGAAQQVRDNFTVLDGLEVHVSNTSGFRTGLLLSLTHDLLGVKIRNMLLWSQTNRTPIGGPNTGSYNVGSSSSPIVFENLLIKKTDNFADMMEIKDRPGYEGHYVISNCTFIGDSGINHRSFSVRANTNLNLKVTNCLSLVPWQWFQAGSGTLTLTGSNNFGGATNSLPAAIQGSPYPVTASKSYDPGAGDFALYVGSTGELLDSPNNDVVNQGVGPASNSDVPTTDILGNTRSGTTANPGAFEQLNSLTTVTRTIGSGKDYATFTLAEADVVDIATSAIGGASLLDYNGAIVFEADAGDYSETLNFDTGGGLTCDPTRNVTWTHASGAEHGGRFGEGVNIVGYCYIREDFAVVDGFSITPSTGGAAGIFGGPEGVILRNLMVHSTDSYAFRLNEGATAAFPGVVENCVAKSGTSSPFDIRSEGSGQDAHWRVVNCTAMATGIKQGFRTGISSSDTLNLELVNNVVHGGTARSYFGFAGPTIVVTGSNNFGPDDGSAPFPVAVQGSPYPITPTTSFSTPLGAGDYAVYMGSNGSLANVSGNDVWQQGVGPGSNSDVPTTDINGVARSGATCNPGAFEADGFVAPTVITRTIDAGGGGDYTTFYLAEAAINGLTSDGTGNLTANNEAIIFEVVAGQYDHTAAFYIQFGSENDNSDMTRNVTFRAQAGSEHGGQYGTGVRLISDSYNWAAQILGCFCNFTNLVVEAKSSSTRPHGFVFAGGNLGGSREPATGIVDRCLYEGSTNTGSDRALVLVTAFDGQDVGFPWAPVTLQNSAAKSSVGLVYQYAGAFTGDTSYIKAVNNTAQTRWGFMWEPRNSTDLTINIEATNNVFLGSPFTSSDQAPWYINPVGGPATNFTLNATGSNNFAYDFTGGNFPVARALLIQ
jgi:hypothetical protein